MRETMTINPANWVHKQQTIVLNRETCQLNVWADWYTLRFTEPGPDRAWDTCLVEDAEGRRVFVLRRFTGDTNWVGGCLGVEREGADPYVVAAQVLFNIV